MASSMDPGLGSTPMAMLPNRCDSNSSRSLGMAKACGRGYTLRTRQWPQLQQQSKATPGFGDGDGAVVKTAGRWSASSPQPLHVGTCSIGAPVIGLLFGHYFAGQL